MTTERYLPPLAMSIAEAVRVSGVGRSTIYEELAAGHLVARKLRRRTVILSTDLKAWLEKLPLQKLPSDENTT